jgi:TPR repeat protein
LIKSKEYFSKSVQLGNSLSMHKLAEIFYEEEKNFGKNEKSRSISLFKESAKLNNVDSMLRLGHIYMQGEIVTKNLQKSLEYFSMAASTENPEALYMLGLIYLDPSCQSVSKALEYLTKASEKGFTSSSLKLFKIYDEGKIVQRNFVLAVWYLEEVLKNDKSEALLVQLATLCFEEYKLKPQKEILQLALSYFSQASLLGNVQSMMFLANLSKEGKLIKKNRSTYLNYLEMAAKRECVDAFYLLGLELSEIDEKKSKFYLKKASKLDHPLSNLKLAEYYFENNSKKAIYYYNQFLHNCNTFLKKQESKNEGQQKTNSYFFFFYIFTF